MGFVLFTDIIINKRIKNGILNQQYYYFTWWWVGGWGAITNRALLIILVTHCIENRVIRIDDAIIYKDPKVRNIFTGWFY